MVQALSPNIQGLGKFNIGNEYISSRESCLCLTVTNVRMVNTNPTSTSPAMTPLPAPPMAPLGDDMDVDSVDTRRVPPGPSTPVLGKRLWDEGPDTDVEGRDGGPKRKQDAVSPQIDCKHLIFTCLKSSAKNLSHGRVEAVFQGLIPILVFQAALLTIDK